MAFALSDTFRWHARDRDERPVTVKETCHLFALAEERLSEAVKSIEIGGHSDDATRIVAALARLTPASTGDSRARLAATSLGDRVDRRALVYLIRAICFSTR